MPEVERISHKRTKMPFFKTRLWTAGIEEELTFERDFLRPLREWSTESGWDEDKSEKYASI